MSTKIKRQLNQINQPLFNETQSKPLNQKETFQKTSHKSRFISTPQKDTKRLTQQQQPPLQRDYSSFITFKKDKIISEIKDLKKQFLSNNQSYSNEQPSIPFYQEEHKISSLEENFNDLNYNDDSFDEEIIPKKQVFKSIFKRYEKPNKGELFFSERQKNKILRQRSGFNYENTNMINPAIYDHENDSDYTNFMRDMNAFKAKKYAEWKNVYLGY